MCPRWESNPRLPACKASTLSTRPGSPLEELFQLATSYIGDNAVTSSIRIAQVFSELVGKKKTRAIWKVYGGMLKYIINYALYLAHYDAYF